MADILPYYPTLSRSIQVTKYEACIKSAPSTEK